MKEKALKLAIVAHQNQVDKSGCPYIEHIIAVSHMLESDILKTVAYLHDIIEDTNVNLNDLEVIGFSKDIILAVDSMTKRKNEIYSDYINRLCQNEIAIKVKIADITHNSDISRLNNPTQKDFERLLKYKKTLEHLNSIVKREENSIE